MNTSAVLARLPLIVIGRGPNSMKVNVEVEAHFHPQYSHKSAADFVGVSVGSAVAAGGEGHEGQLVEVQDMVACLVLHLEASNWAEVVRRPVQSCDVAVSGFVGIHSTYHLRSACLQVSDIALLVVLGVVVGGRLLTC